MLGAYIGDIVGSRFEWHNIKSKKFDLFTPKCSFTDDSVMTCAVAEVFKKYKDGELARDKLHEELVKEMKRLGRKYPYAGYGGNFRIWLTSDSPKPYNSLGNGSAMRCSAAGFLADTLEEAEKLGEISAEVTHNHPEGIKGAKSVAAAIFMARKGHTKSEIKRYIEDNYYTLDFTLDDIRDTYSFDVTCQGTVPQAIEAFLEADGFEDAIRNAISIGGDSDTLACITGAMAEAFYGVPDDIKRKALNYLDDEMKETLIMEGK